MTNLFFSLSLSYEPKTLIYIKKKNFLGTSVKLNGTAIFIYNNDSVGIASCTTWLFNGYVLFMY